MTDPLLLTGIFSALFLISHLLLSAAQVRDPLSKLLGEKVFLGLYSLLAAITLGGLIFAYNQAPHTHFLWPPTHGLRHLPLLIMPLALILVVAGITTRNPTSIATEGSINDPEVAKGILRITRHPMQWGIVLWAMVHILANGDLASLLFFGSFALLALLGSMHIDRRRQHDWGEKWQSFAAVTSYVPLAAILAKRQRLVWKELYWQMGLGLLVFVVLLHFHQYLFGVRPY